MRHLKTFVAPMGLALGALLVLGSQLHAQDAAKELATPLAKMELKDGASIVFLGDSITHQCLYTQYVEDFLYTRFPGQRFKIHNAGVGGARAIDALARFEKDVARYKPDYVTILLGMNDGTYRPFDLATFKTYHKDMTQLVKQIAELDAKPVLMTPTMFDARAARLRGGRRRNDVMLEEYNSVLAYYGSWLRDVAHRGGHGFVDMYGPLNNLTWNERKKQPKFTMIPDAVHPNPNGQLVMAAALISDMQLRRQVSNIRITKSPKGKAVGRGANGELSDIQFTDRGVTFSWLAKSLPWVVPEDAQIGVKLTKMGHKLSREALEVHGLPAGKYQLLIDGEEIGEYTHVQLARHIELQANKNTPQYKQAAMVAELNKQRNAGPVRGMRGEWSKFQRVDRLERQAKAKPEDEKLKQRLEATRKQIDGMAERVAKHEAAAKEIEDKIFKVNQPKLRKYELRRIE